MKYYKKLIKSISLNNMSIDKTPDVVYYNEVLFM